MTDLDPTSGATPDDALDAEDYLLDSMGDAITLWEALRHPMSVAAFARFDALRHADPWAARESVAQLVEYFQQATGALDAPADSLAELFLIHCTNAAEPPPAEDPTGTGSVSDDEDAFLECLIGFDLLPQAGELLSQLDLAEAAERPALEHRLGTLRARRDA